MSAPVAGWYPDATKPGTQRYWDGENWTEQYAPDVPQRSGMSATTLVFAIVAGILLAGALIWGGYSILHANDGMDCSMRNVDHASKGEPLENCD